VISSEKLKNNIGLVSLQRGPLMYCAEWTDNNNRVSNLVLPATENLQPEYRQELLNGVTVLKGNATAVITDSKQNTVSSVVQPFTAIPYYAWANRGKGEMAVWLPAQIKDVQIISQ
jgi:DUF1680 family protein